MRIVFMGTPDFAVPCLNALLAHHEVLAVVTQPDKVQGRGHKVVFSAIKKLALSHDLPVLQPVNVNNTDFNNLLEKLDADAFVVVAYGQILRKRLRKMTKYGSINVHASLLPLLRGGAPIHRSIINGAQETGVTTMRVERKLDSGAIYLQKRIAIEPTNTVADIHDQLAEIGAELLLETLAQLPALKPIPQDHELATFAPIITKADRIIDWSMDARDLYNKIRGLNPWPIAYGEFRGKLIQVLSSRVCKDEVISDHLVGEIIKVTPEGPLIQCGKGRLLLLAVKPAGKKLMSGADFCRGYRCEKGEVLN